MCIYIYSTDIHVSPPLTDLPFCDVFSSVQRLGEHSTHNVIRIDGLYSTSIHVYIYIPKYLYDYVYIHVRSETICIDMQFAYIYIYIYHIYIYISHIPIIFSI